MAATTLLHFLALSNVQTPITQCSDKSPLPLSFNYDNCSDIICCKNGGTTEFFRFNFTVDRPVTSLQVQLRAVLTTDIYTVGNFPPPEPNACSRLEDAKCPLDAGQTVTYSTTYLLPEFPHPVVALVEVRMVDQYNKTLTCLVHPLKLLPPGQSCGKKSN